MACGCAVVPVSDGCVAPAISLANFSEGLERNFVALQMEPLEAGCVRKVLQGIPWAEVLRACGKSACGVNNSLERTLDLMEATYRTALQEGYARCRRLGPRKPL